MAVHFIFSCPHPVSHFVSIEMRVDGIESDEVVVRLPAWRPGRYELGNFAKNIRKWQPYNQNGEPLSFRKLSKDSWQVQTDGANELIVKYDYYCAQPDAGACYVDDELFYINPVHCCLFITERMHDECTVTLDLPKSFQIASSLEKYTDRKLIAKDFHELVDSPVMASASFQMRSYTIKDVRFFVWLQGECSPDWERILTDFSAFTIEQMETMEDFPVKEYHFLILVLPYLYYHGVEHLKSTVLVLGPGTKLMQDEIYDDLIGVASHELFHSWNVKSIRPAEMVPYKYTRENYSKLGYVYEGVTTYYGDLFLARSGVFTSKQFFNEISVRLQKHFNNPARFNLSVADSSFDTWLDGYTPGIPGRKTSIYDEGCITALMTDLIIRKETDGDSSLDDVMRLLYSDFGKKGIGYTDQDYIAIVENVAGISLAEFFIDHVYGTEDKLELLTRLLAYAGCELKRTHSKSESERFFGFKYKQTDTQLTKVSAIYPASPAFENGLGLEDEIVAINESKVENNIDELLRNVRGQKIILTVINPMRRLKDIALEHDGKEYYPRFSIVRSEFASPEQKRFFKQWMKKSDLLVEE